MPNFNDKTTTTFMAKQAKQRMDEDLWAEFMNPDIYTDEHNEVRPQEGINEQAASKSSRSLLINMPNPM